jgi:uncharacterized protein (DUF362 family)
MSTRRDFLHRAGLAAGGLLVAPFGVSCAGVPVVDAGDPTREGVTLGLFRADSLARPEDAVVNVLDGLDLDWLGAGDSVFVKLAMNSAHSHPAVTSPAAVRGLCETLFARGAGRVLVGDQSGAVSVRLARGEQRFSSTENVARANGLLDAIEASGAEPHFFDDQGFEDGYVEARFGFESSWSRTPHIARVVTEVDHVVYLPRISSHALTGYTHGHKIAVGFLRDDARFDMHHDAGRIYEKYTEINYCEQIESKLRLVLTLAESVLIEGGPDVGVIAHADPRIVIASPHLANHDAIAVAMLTWAREHLPKEAAAGVPHGPWASTTNLALRPVVESRSGIPWDAEGVGLPSMYLPHDWAAGVQADHALRRGYELIGGVPRAIPVTLVGERPDDTLRAHLEDHELATTT